MKKIIKVKIKKEKVNGATQFTYPKVCRDNDHSKYVQYLAYEKDPNNYPVDYEKGGKVAEEYAIGVIEEGTVFDALVADADIEEITAEEADTFGKTWNPQTTKIADPEKVIAITAKAVLGEALTKEEKDALNSDNETVGINKTKQFDIYEHI